MPINITIDHLNSLTRSDTDSDDSGEQWPFVPRKTPSVGQNSDGNGERSESNTNYRKPRVEEYAPSDDGDGGKWYDGDDDPEEIPTYHKGSGPRPRMGHDNAIVGEGGYVTANALSNAADASSSSSGDSSDEAPHARRPRGHTVRFEEPERPANPLVELETKLKHVGGLLAEAKRAIIAKSENPKETHVDMDELFHRFCERVKWEEAKRAERLERENQMIVQEAKMMQKAMLAEVEKEREFKAKVQACVVDLFGPQCLEWSSRGGPPPLALPPPSQPPLPLPPRQAMEPVCTWLSKALICKEALKELGVDYFERDEYFLVDQRLDTTTQQELVDRTTVLKEYIKRFQDAPVVAGLNNGTWCKHVKPPGCPYPLVIPVDRGVHGDWDDDEDRRSEFSGTTSSSDLSQLSWDATSITSNTSLGLASNEAVEDSWAVPLGCEDLIDLEMGCSEVGTLKIPSSREDLSVRSSRDDTGESASTDDAHENSPTERSASAPQKETVPERKKPLRVYTHPRSVGRNEKKELAEPKKHAKSIGGETEPEHSIGTNSATSPCPKTPTSSSTATRAMRKAKRDRARVRSVGSKKHAHDMPHEDPYAWPPGLPPLGLDVHLPSPKGWRERTKPPQESPPQADEAQLNALLIPAPPWGFNRLQQAIELTATPSTSARGVAEEVPTFTVVDAIHPDEPYQQPQLARLIQPAAPRQDSQPMSSHQLVPDLADIQRWIQNTGGAAAFPVSGFTGFSGVPPSPAAAFTEGPAVSAQPHPSGVELGAQGYDTPQGFITASVRDASREPLERDSSTARWNSDQSRDPKDFDLPARQRSPSLQDFPKQERDIYSNIIEQLESLVQSLTAETSRMLEDELRSVREKARKNKERERRQRSARRNSHIWGHSSSSFTSHSPPHSRDYRVPRHPPPPRPAPAPGPSSYLSPDAPSPAHYSPYNTASNPTGLYAQHYSHPITSNSSPLSSITSTEVSGGQNDQEPSRAVAADDEDFVRRPILRTDSGITTSIAAGEAPGLRHRRSNGVVASGGIGGVRGLADITRSNSSQSKEQVEARSSGDPERGVEAPEVGPVWVEALSYPAEESVMIDTRSGTQVSLRPPKIPMPLLGPPPPPGYLPPGHQLDDPSQISSHQSVFEERNFMHLRELDDGSRQSRFIHPHHRGADSSSRRDYRSSSVRHGRHGNRERALVLWQSSYSPERRPHSTHAHSTHSRGRRPRTPSSHSIRDTDYELPETVVFAAAPHSRLIEGPPTLPRQSPLPMVNYPPPVAFPPGIKAKVVDVYHQSPFKFVPRTREVSPNTFFVSILLSTHSSGSEFRVFRIELDKSEVDDRALFQTIKSTFHELRGWRRRFSFKGVTDIKFAQYGQDELPWHQNADPRFRRLIVTPISSPIDYGAYAGNQLLRYFYSPRSLQRASSQWTEAFRELNGGKPVPKILDPHRRILSNEVYAPPLDEPSGQGILFTEGWLPDRIIGAACSVVFLSFVVALTWSFLKDPEEGIAAGGYVLTALSSIIGMVSLVNALDTVGS